MTETPDFDQVLDICLNRLGNGETLEACLASYPSYARQLAPLLRVASAMQAPQSPPMLPQAVSEGRIRMLAKAAQLREWQREQPAPARRGGLIHKLIGMRRLAVASLVSVLLVFSLLSAGTVSAASGSLPGSPLYPVKRASEALVSSLALTPELQAQTHMKWADRRLREIEALVARDGVVDEALFEALARETGQGLVAAERAGLGSLEAAASHLDHQKAVLELVLKKAPPTARAGLQRALEVSAQGRDRARSALEKAASPGPPTTPPGQAGDKKPPQSKPETPSGAAGKPGRSGGASDGKDKAKPAGTDSGQRPEDPPSEGVGQGQGGGQDKDADPNQGQGKGKGQDHERPDAPGQGQDKGPGQGAPPADNPGQGHDNGKDEKSDNPGKDKGKDD